MFFRKKYFSQHNFVIPKNTKNRSISLQLNIPIGCGEENYFQALNLIIGEIKDKIRT